MADTIPPIWSPSKNLISFLYDAIDEKLAFKKFRQASSAYIKNKKVRDFVFKRNNFCCTKCQSLKDLQVDHISSVWRCWKDKLFNYCNSIENLQTLCAYCNSSKKP